MAAPSKGFPGPMAGEPFPFSIEKTIMAMSDIEWGLPDPHRQAEFYADVPTKRLLAFIIDTILISLITLLLIPLTAFTAIFFLGFLFLVVGLIYRTVSLSNRSATPGMRLMSIEFRDIRGERLSLGLAFMHTVFLMISMSLVFPQVISIILMLTTARAQGLSDLILGTAVINRSASH